MQNTIYIPSTGQITGSWLHIYDVTDTYFLCLWIRRKFCISEYKGKMSLVMHKATKIYWFMKTNHQVEKHLKASVKRANILRNTSRMEIKRKQTEKL